MRAIFRTVLVTALTALCAGAPPALPTTMAQRATAYVTGRSYERPGMPVPVSEFAWPLSPAPSVSRPFQPPSRPYGPGHRGADLLGTEGQPVLSAGAGVVVYAGPLADRGVVSVDHADGLRTTYEPLEVAVRAGQLVARGEVLGTLAAGHAGCPAPACLHWGLRRDREYLDPLLLVRPAHVRLLPWAPEP